MKHLIKFLFVFFAIQSCSNNSGRELISVEKNNFSEKKPMGMVLVNRGSFAMGNPSDTSQWGTMNKSKQVSVESFWMDEVMVTNKMYKQFVYWVADSVFRSTLDEEMQKVNASGKWLKSLNREQQRERDAFLFTSDPTYTSLKIINSNLINYAYGWYDYNSAGLSINSFDANKRNRNTDISKTFNRKNLYDKDSSYIDESGQIINLTKRVEVKTIRDFSHTKIVNVYPDTTSWINDFKHSQTDDYARNYFSSKAFNNYPVVGVSWEQANAFCIWRTTLYLRGSKNDSRISAFRLPTEAEWEFAARSRSQNSTYPWQTDETYKKTKKGVEFYANFKSSEGNFSQDGYIILSPVGSFAPNELGIYDLAGNAAEWTSTAYFESGSSDALTLNPNVSFNALNSDPYILKRKVVRGGSFKDSKDFISTELRTFEYQNVGRSYIGFRCVRSKLGY